MIRSGWFRLFRIGGIDYRYNVWGLLLLAFLFVPHPETPWRAFGLPLLILAHELGHAAFARAVGGAAFAIDIGPFWGFCRWNGPATPVRRSIVAWGGVVANASLLVGAIAAGAILQPAPFSAPSRFLEDTVLANGIMIFLNLLPVPGLDGREALALPYRGWVSRARRAPAVARSSSSKRRVDYLREVKDDDDRPAPGPTIH
jgi:Zn-dependent protease